MVHEVKMYVVDIKVGLKRKRSESARPEPTKTEGQKTDSLYLKVKN